MATCPARILRGARDARFSLALFLMNSFSWALLLCEFLMTYAVEELADLSHYLLLLFLTSASIATLLGSHKVDRLFRPELVSAWVLLGVAVSPSAYLLSSSWLSACLVFALAGLAAGLYMPLIATSFLSYTSFEDRGRLCSGILAPSIGVVTLFLSASAHGRTASMLNYIAVWRSLGLPLLILSYRAMKLKRGEHEVHVRGLYRLLVVAIWGHFLAVSAIFRSVLFKELPIALGKALILNTAYISLALALLGGFLLDYYGRKSVLALSFAGLGLSISAMPFVSLRDFLPVYAVAEAAAVGVVWLAMVFVVAGDFYEASTRAQMFSLAFILLLARSASSPYLILHPAALRVDSQLMMLAASVLFLASFLMLFFVPELLPSEVAEKRRIKEYVRRAKEIKRRYEAQGESRPPRA